MLNLKNFFQHLSLFINKHQLWIFLLILALGIYWRLVNIFNLAPIIGDSGRDILVAKHMVLYRENLFISPAAAGGYNYLKNTPFYFHLLAFLYFIAGSEKGLIVAHALLSSLTIVLAYLISQKLFKGWLVLVLPFFIAVDTFLISFSKMIWQPNFLPFFQAWSLLFFLKSDRAHLKYLFIFVQLSFITFNLHLSYAPFLLVSLGFAAYKLIRYLAFKDFFLLLFLCLLNFIIYFLQSGSLYQNNHAVFGSILLGGQDLPIRYYNNILANTIELFRGFSIYNFSAPIALVIFLLFIWLIFKIGRNSKNNEKIQDICYLMGLMLATFFLSSFYFSHLPDHYLIPFYLIIFLSFVLVLDRLKKIFAMIVPVLVILATIFLTKDLSLRINKRSVSDIELHTVIAKTILDYNAGPPAKVTVCLKDMPKCNKADHLSVNIWLYLEKVSGERMGKIYNHSDGVIDNFWPVEGKNDFLVCTYDLENCLTDAGETIDSTQMLKQFIDGQSLLLRK